MITLDRAEPATLAYVEIRELELLLRRVVRWELMAAYGRHWLNALDELSEAIQERERKEKLASLYDGNTSELSYLSLGELINFIFRRKWHEIFKMVFTGDKGLEANLHKEIVPLRNKVAHFRPTTYEDLDRLRVLCEVKKALADYYGNKEQVDAFLSSDPEWASEQIDEESKILSDALHDSGHSTVWVAYGEVECLRARGFGLGLGLYCSHVFLELRCPTDPNMRSLSEWTHRERFLVCFTTVQARLIRVFWPLSLSAAEIRKSMLSFQKLVSTFRMTECPSRENHSLGEIVIPRVGNSFVGLVF